MERKTNQWENQERTKSKKREREGRQCGESYPDTSFPTADERYFCSSTRKTNITKNWRK
jgi:hypothetical protein